MCNPKTIVIIQINPFQTSVPPHKSCFEYRIACGTKLLLLPSFNPLKKYPHLSTIGLVRVQRINNLIEKYVHLATLKIIITPQLSGRDKLFLSTPGIFLHDGAIYQCLILTLDSTSVVPMPVLDSLDYLPVPLSTTNAKNFYVTIQARFYNTFVGPTE